MKTRIFIVRHTETVGNIEKRLTGRQDYSLTKKGEKLVVYLTKELQNIKFNAIYSSTSGRAVATVEPLAKLNNLPVIQSENLCEMFFGDYDGWKWEDVDKIQPEIKANQNRINEIYGIPHQETMQEVAERMYKYITKISKENQGNTILIGSHGVAIEAFLRKIVDLPFTYEREKFCQHNVAINELNFENDKFEIVRLADVDYLNKYKEGERE